LHLKSISSILLFDRLTAFVSLRPPLTNQPTAAMSDTVDIVAIIIPRPGKADRVQELLSEVGKYVKDKELGTIRYHLQRETKGDAPTFVMLETYKDMASIKVHGGSEPFKTLGRAFKKEDLLAEPMKVIFTKPVAGFASRL